MQPLKSLGFYESFLRVRRRDHDVHILSRAFAENGVEITRHWPQMLVSYDFSRLSSTVGRFLNRN